MWYTETMPAKPTKSSKHAKKPAKRKTEVETTPLDDFLMICDAIALGKGKVGVFLYPDFLAEVAEEIRVFKKP